jgi:hypothetical protein
MNAKAVIRALLILFAVGSLAYMGFLEVSARNGGQVSGDADPLTVTSNGVTPELLVYYLSTGKDCATCVQIEAYTKETLETYFAEDMESGRIQWRFADMDRPEHKHFFEDYNLYTKSIVLVDVENGERGAYENLEKVWDYVYNKDQFIEYVREHVESFMKEHS